MQQRPPPPPGKNMAPMEYYQNLIAMGFSPYQAANAVQGSYGSAQDYVQKNQQTSQLYGAGGSLAGTGVAYGIKGLLASGGSGAAGAAGAAGAEGGAVMMPSALGGAGALEGTSAAGASTLGSIGSVALPIAAAAAAASTIWEDGMKDIVRGKGDRADWTNMGVDMFAGPGINMGLRLLGKRSIGAMMKSGKSNDQALRDDFRSKLKETGVIGNDYKVSLADGSSFDIGKDGKTKYTNTDGKTTRNAWDVDFSNPLAKYAVEQIDPMIRRIYGPDAEKAGIKPEQYTGMIVNAITSNAKSQADVLANINSIFGKSKFAQEAGLTTPQQEVSRPEKGKVARLSPGIYRSDSGAIVKGKTMRDALEQAYGKTTQSSTEK